MGAVVSGPGHSVGRPSGARSRDRGVNAFVAIDGRISKRAKPFCIFQYPAQEMMRARSQTKLILFVEEEILLS